jgi:homoserine kinase
MIRVRVPATTANLGPGFDVLGLALGMYAEVSFEKNHEKLTIEGCPEEYCNEENLIYTSFLKTYKAMGIKEQNVKITIHSNIPAARGLGSSAACVVAGMAGALIMENHLLDKRLLLDIGTRIEGHPDNVAPAIYGGFTATVQSEGQIFLENFKVHPDIVFYALIPSNMLSTNDARGVLPKMISHEDAVFNISRMPFLLRGLEKNDGDLIRTAINDKLHQPFRKALIPEFEEVVKICYNNGCSGVYLSGAGPTIMGIGDSKVNTSSMKASLNKLRNNWEVKPLKIDNDGVKILRS